MPADTQDTAASCTAIVDTGGTRISVTRSCVHAPGPHDGTHQDPDGSRWRLQSDGVLEVYQNSGAALVVPHGVWAGQVSPADGYRDEVAQLRRELASADKIGMELSAKLGEMRRDLAEAVAVNATVIAESDRRKAERDSLAARLADAGPDALRAAAAELQAMSMDPFDLLTESVGIRGPLAVSLWLRDRANATPSTSDVQVLGDQVLVDQPKEGDRG
jgi:hypothetical protein